MPNIYKIDVFMLFSMLYNLILKPFHQQLASQDLDRLQQLIGCVIIALG